MKDTLNTKALNACKMAYGQMLQMPHDDLRAKSQKTLVQLRDVIAEAHDVSPEFVQNSFENAVMEARKQACHIDKLQLDFAKFLAADIKTAKTEQTYDERVHLVLDQIRRDALKQ